MSENRHFKDEHLNELAEWGNVAQFVSFDPTLKQRFSRVTGEDPNFCYPSMPVALSALIRASQEKRINIRSFKPDSPQGNEFIYGIPTAEMAEEEIRRIAGLGCFVIANETVDIKDGGVSGVAHKGVIEFAPGATPRIVEEGGVVSVEKSLGTTLIETVYGFRPELPDDDDFRIEFSVHPLPRGFRNNHTILWELDKNGSSDLRPLMQWPNLFSEFLGDKVFGLLFADALGLAVPRTLVISRVLPPFEFGRQTGESMKWMRTAPRVPEPGLFPTVRGWTDPFELLNGTPGAERLSAVMIQDEVKPSFSGAFLTGANSRPIIEGVNGFGDKFMLGQAQASVLDQDLLSRLEGLHDSLLPSLGSVRAEWVFDDHQIWILQLQQETARSSGRVIVSGKVDSEVEFDVKSGLVGLRELVTTIAGKSIGIKLLGEVGITSHIADVLRRNNIPSRIAADFRST
jgi:hypothetical protein